MATLNGTVYSCNGAYSWTWTTNTTNGDWVPVTSAGGGTVAPVPPPAAPPAKRHDGPTEYATVKDAAEAVCGYACARSLEQPRFYVFKVLPQDRPVTVDWLEREIVEANGRRQTKLDLSKLSIGLRGWDLTGLVFQAEGWEVR